MRRLNAESGREDLLLKIGIHEGPCLAVTLNDRLDYFGQTVNIAARVQELALSQSIFATQQVVENPLAARMLVADAVVVGIEQHPVTGAKRPETGLERLQQEGLEKPGGVRQMPLDRARIGHGLYAGVFGRQRRIPLNAKDTTAATVAALRYVKRVPRPDPAMRSSASAISSRSSGQ